MPGLCWRELLHADCSLKTQNKGCWNFVPKATANRARFNHGNLHENNGRLSVPGITTLVSKSSFLAKCRLSSFWQLYLTFPEMRKRRALPISQILHSLPGSSPSPHLHLAISHITL